MCNNTWPFHYHWHYKRCLNMIIMLYHLYVYYVWYAYPKTGMPKEVPFLRWLDLLFVYCCGFVTLYQEVFFSVKKSFMTFWGFEDHWINCYRRPRPTCVHTHVHDTRISKKSAEETIVQWEYCLEYFYGLQYLICLFFSFVV